MAPKMNYFTCTLGHAAALKERAHAKGSEVSFTTVLQMLEHQASLNPHSLALGVAELLVEGSPPHNAASSFTFSELYRMTGNASVALSREVEPRRKTDDETGEVAIALLCPSNIEFVLTWLGLMRLGYTVLFLAYVFLWTYKSTLAKTD